MYTTQMRRDAEFVQDGKRVLRLVDRARTVNVFRMVEYWRDFRRWREFRRCNISNINIDRRHPLASLEFFCGDRMDCILTHDVESSSSSNTIHANILKQNRQLLLFSYTHDTAAVKAYS